MTATGCACAHQSAAFSFDIRHGRQESVFFPAPPMTFTKTSSLKLHFGGLSKK